MADDRAPFERLTDRERDVFTLIGRGLGTRDIARELVISVKTVETSHARSKEKLGLANAHELTLAGIHWAQS